MALKYISEYKKRVSHRFFFTIMTMVIGTTRTKIPRAAKMMKDIELRSEIDSGIDIGGVVVTG